MYHQFLGSLLGISWLVFWYFFFYTSARKKSRSRFNAWFQILTVMLLIFVGIEVLLLFFLPGAPKLPMLAIVMGAACVVAGQLIMYQARRALSHLSNTALVFRLSEKHVRTGPYRYSAHPMYWGLWLALFGSGLLLGNVEAMSLVMLFVTPTLVLRGIIESI